MANDFKPTIGGKVPKADADKWIEKYDKDVRKDKDKDTKSVFFGRDVIQEILSRDGCAGITFFFGMKYNDYAKKDTTNLIMVGTKEDGTLLWEPEASGSDTLSAYDWGSTCPPYCPQ